MLRDTNKEAVIADELFHNNLQSWQRNMLAMAEHLRQHGWRRCDFSDRFGRSCALGAAAAVLRIHPAGISWEARKEIQELEKYIGIPTICWNDNIIKSGKDVIRTLQLIALGG